MNKDEEVSLEQLASNFSVVILDACVLQSSLPDQKEPPSNQKNSLPNKKEPKNTEALIAEVKEHLDFQAFLQKQLSLGINCYATPSILEEYSNSHYPYKKKIKRNGSVRDRPLLFLRRKRRDVDRGRAKLVDAFYDNDRILRLDKEEGFLYLKISRKYSEVKEKNNLSDADFDMLLSGLAVSCVRGPTAIVSNDLRINSALKHILRSEGHYRKRLGFFIRCDSFLFKRMR